MPKTPPKKATKKPAKPMPISKKSKATKKPPVEEVIEKKKIAPKKPPEAIPEIKVGQILSGYSKETLKKLRERFDIVPAEFIGPSDKYSGPFYSVVGTLAKTTKKPPAEEVLACPYLEGVSHEPGNKVSIALNYQTLVVALQSVHGMKKQYAKDDRLVNAHAELFALKDFVDQFEN